MATTVTRPTFFEGEILPASDLVATVNYPRAQMARHQRNLHIWGVASGLNLVAPTVPGGPPTLKAGVATDGTGREVVVPADVLLSSADFLSQVASTNDPTTLYPVFLNGLDVPQTSTSTMTGSCNTSQPTATQETYAISYGAPGSELDAASQTPPGVTDPPSDGVTTVWKILVGFVLWDPIKGQFSDVANYNPTNQVGIQSVGVNASEIVSGSGSVLIATHPAGFSGANPVMALQMHEAKSGPQLVFGQLNATGAVASPLLTVTSTGDLIAAGQISGAVKPGSVQVQSGIAFDGMILPLPVGINPADVGAGKVTVHTHVSVHYESVSPAGLVVTFPLECRVDTSTRRVHCRVVDITAGPPFLNVLPAWCDYLVIVAVPASSGGGS